MLVKDLSDFINKCELFYYILSSRPDKKSKKDLLRLEHFLEIDATTDNIKSLQEFIEDLDKDIDFN